MRKDKFKKNNQVGQNDCGWYIRGTDNQKYNSEVYDRVDNIRTLSKDDVSELIEMHRKLKPLLISDNQDILTSNVRAFLNKCINHKHEEVLKMYYKDALDFLHDTNIPEGYHLIKGYEKHKYDSNDLLDFMKRIRDIIDNKVKDIESQEIEKLQNKKKE